MRIFKNYKFVALLLLLVLSACKKELPVYDQKDGNGVGFVFDRYKDSTMNLSFVYEKESVKRMTGYIEVRSVGFVTNYDRPVTIRQVEVAGAFNGKAGVHYLSLADVEVAGKYVIKAGEASAKLPIVFLRDKSMLDQFVNIRFEIVENEHFKLGMKNDLIKDIVISDMPTRPDGWNIYSWGAYGLEKHRFMITSTGKRWDEEWLDVIDLDANERNFWLALVREELNKRNSAVGEKLTEKDGTVVVFPL